MVEEAAKDIPATFNARAEAVTERPMIRSAFRQRCCIIPASGFYEWTGGMGASDHICPAPPMVSRCLFLGVFYRVARCSPLRAATGLTRYDRAWLYLTKS
jgi:putative SOS response-associated peptidase YedK